MAETFEVACPTCGKSLKVPTQFAGKKIKCKGCLEAFVAKPAAAKAPAKPAAAPASGAKPEPTAKAPAHQKVTWDDDADNDDKPVGVIHEEDVARCPHCAKELESADAIICIHCGFNNRTRTHAETKRVYEADSADWTMHLGPAILCVIGIIVFLILDLVVYLNMREWMVGSFLESDEDGPDGRKKMYVSPGLFITTMFFMSIAAIAPMARFAYKRLIKEYTPPEQKMEDKK
jgi:hypothetical protein